MTSIQLEACDTNSAGRVEADLYRFAPGLSQLLAAANTGTAATPGCTQINTNLTTPATIDNSTNTYQVRVLLTGGTIATQFLAVRIFYNLQVSPAPAAATFNDVPTSHPFFLFIQALAAAGITGGCNTSPPLYCPDDPVTRGQMAVFISRALGLQFAP